MIVTFPGRFGDLLWALPTVRAISEAVQEPVDLICAGEFRSICPLLALQPYIKSAQALEEWGLHPPDEWSPPSLVLKDNYRVAVHLGYRGWPSMPLAQFVYAQAQQHYGSWFTLPPLELERPWIDVPPGKGAIDPLSAVAAFTEEWFELKVGLCHILGLENLTPPESAWTKLPGGHLPRTWVGAARVLQRSEVIVADCSALHVLAVALGRTVLLVEPSEARWQDIFYPLGKTGRVKVIMGHDGRPTFDSVTVRGILLREQLHAG